MRASLSCGRVLTVAVLVALGSIPVVAHADTTEDEIATTRAAIDDAAQQWFETQDAVARLDADVAALERRVAEATRRADEVRVIARARAVEIYTGTVDFESMLTTSSALDSARRAELLNSANADAQQAIDDLDAVTEDLNARRSELDARRAEQVSRAEDLQNRQASLDEQLRQLKQQADREQDERAAAPRNTSDGAGASGQAGTGASVPPSARPSNAPAAAPAPAVMHPRHNEPFLVCTRAHESSGDYAAVNPSGYYGAYQFAPSTWNVTASHAGRIDLVGVLPTRASVYDQDELAWTLYQWQGKRPWNGRC